ncbi:MAG: type II toxin-antitoxin system VapC family toxin [Geminicoccaceae bacterium]
MPTATGVEVVDASALAALLFGEPESAQVVGRLGSGRLVAPALLEFEFANICVTKLRRHPQQRAAIPRGYGIRARIAIEVVPVEQGEVVAAADASGLTAYDRAYLWLARRLGAGLITLDRKLAAAMEAPQR